MQPPLLTGQLTTLRALAPADAASIQRHADDTQVWETLFEGFPSPYTFADAKCAPRTHAPVRAHVYALYRRPAPGEVTK